MLFSEPKIPQSTPPCFPFVLGVKFQCSSASRKFLNRCGFPEAITKTHSFQCSSASRKFLNPSRPKLTLRRTKVSVLFSEPKIPQSKKTKLWSTTKISFSALQRAENSSIRWRRIAVWSCAGVSVLFSEPKIPQSARGLTSRSSLRTVSVLFSEPKIPQSCRPDFAFQCRRMFQCSSASRKFLNGADCSALPSPLPFQCSSASRKFLNHLSAKVCTTSACRFSALQRAENSSINKRRRGVVTTVRFQCSSASRKFLNADAALDDQSDFCGFSALQRAENSSIQRPRRLRRARAGSFSALQRAENSSINLRNA